VTNTGGLVYNQTSSTGSSCSSTIHLDDGEAFCMGHVFTTLQRLKVCCLHVLSAHFARWTKPLRTSLPLATLADLGRSKEELLAENALLRQQLIVLKRQVKRPAFTRTDRILLVLLATLVRTWQQALLIVQPEPVLRLPSGALSPLLETEVKGLFSQAKSCRPDHCPDQANGQGQSTLRR